MLVVSARSDGLVVTGRQPRISQEQLQPENNQNKIAALLSFHSQNKNVERKTTKTAEWTTGCFQASGDE